MNIAFLFGAGVSIPSGMDSTETLTNKVMDGKSIIRDYQGRYRNFLLLDERSIDKGIEFVGRIKKLFFILKNDLGMHYSFKNRIINYEDYYYMADSLNTDENTEYENPIVAYFSNNLLNKHTYLFKPIDGSIDLNKLTEEAKNYIKDLITDSLKKAPSNLEQFKIVSNVNSDNDYEKAFIFTLNHDTLIEQYLLENKILFSDGFVSKDNEIKIWEYKSFKEKINLLKLHGSINWFNYDTNDSYEKNVCIYNNPPRDYFRALINIGSFNKLTEYSRGINFDLQWLFKEYLTSCKRIIISGYSFGDKGINNRIINWLYGDRERKIIVIHKNEEELFRNARFAIYRHWQEDKRSKTDLFRIIPKWFQETNWDEIKSTL